MKKLRRSKSCWYVICLLILSMLFTGCNGGNEDINNTKNEVKEVHQFTWWIPSNDASGTYYENYKENVVVQWINNQYWNTEEKGLGSSDNGVKLALDFTVPIIGVESDNFNTMIATGEYPEIIDLSYSDQSEQQLYEDGVLMDITDLVEKYLPNYLKIIEENPELKPFVSRRNDEGDWKYYALYDISDDNIQPWEGYMYRRDWLVKYAEPSTYVWDWNSEYVKENGYPRITPLSKAQEADDLTGWKENEISMFEKSEGDDPENDYTDNVIFPSGKGDPYTISDWEWMMEAFSRAIEAEGYSDNINAYPTTVFYPGYMQAGDLVSSFGGGPLWYIDEAGNSAFGGASEDFKTYVECLNTWNENGWLDRSFASRGSDQFFQINSTGVGQGMVGLFVGGKAMLGTTIRETVSNAAAKKDAMVMGAQLPINDTYGNVEQKFIEPHVFYQQGKLGIPTGFTTLCEEKDMKALFSMINWMYSEEGGRTISLGLNQEQYKSMKFQPDLYADTGIDSAYTESVDSDGLSVYTMSVPVGNDVVSALKGHRMATNLNVSGNKELGYYVDFGRSLVITKAIEAWDTYSNDGYILDYNSLMNDKESSQYAKINTYINDFMGQEVPKLINDGLENWETYTKKLNKYDPASITDMYQQLIERTN